MAFGPDMEERIVNIFKDSKVKNILHIGACLGEEAIATLISYTLGLIKGVKTLFLGLSSSII